MPYALTPADDTTPETQKAGAYTLTPASEAQPDLPQPYLDRLARGNALHSVLATTSAAVKGFGTAFGSEPLGLSPEHVQQLRDIGVFADPATGRGGALRFMNEAVAQPVSALGDLLQRGASGVVGAVSSAFGELVSEGGASEGMSQEAKNEAANFMNYALLRGDHEVGRAEHGPVTPHDQPVGIAPREVDFSSAAKSVTDHVHTAADVFNPPDLKEKIANDNLKQLWEERGIHPAEAAHDARNDALLKHDLTQPAPHLLDTSDIPPVRGSPVQVGTPRTELAKTGDPMIDNILDSEVTNRVIDSPKVNRDYSVPYTAGGSVPLEDPTIFIDNRFPRSFTIDGVTFDPADPFTIHENTEQHAMDALIKGGMDAGTAYKVAHFEVAEKAEGAWYAAHGIDKEKAEAAYAPYMAQVQHEKGERAYPPNLYERPYPHDNPSAALRESIDEPKPTKEEIALAREILGANETEGKLHAVGADVSPPMTPLERQPAHPPGRLLATAQDALNKLYDIGRDLQMKVAPMAVGSTDSRALAKDFANSLRRNRWDWSRIDDDIAKRFTPEQRKRMWDAADEESVARQLGESREHQGLVTLEPEERRAVEDLQARAQSAWLRARDLGMVEGDGLPAYTPRMLINAAGALEKDGRVALNRLPESIGRNLRTTTANLLHRKYMTAEDTEAAAKAKYGEDAALARDIRVLPLATSKLEDAIAGRTLINNIRDYGKRTGEDTVADGFKPVDSANKWFTVDHPAFKTWKPKFEMVDGKVQAVKDQDGNIVFEQRDLYVRGDFEGPLRAVLSQKNGAAYAAMMSAKAKTMSLIMNSPLIHNAVEWGRAIPAMPGKVATFKIYFEGNRAKNDVGTMHEAIDAGLVPIGHRFFNQDISSIMEAPDLTPGRSWTAKILAAVPGLFDEAAGTAVKQAIDRAGNFWHNTLLWDRVADLQMGLYTNFRDDMIAKGVDRQTAARAAAHWANRYAGSLPVEAMSANARKISNMLMFSRTFTLGNLGVMKDMLTGLPKDVMSQIERDMGQVDPNAVGYAKALARRKALAVVALDIGLMYVGNSILQNVTNVMLGDSTLDKEMHGYAERLSNALTTAKDNPLRLLTSLSATNVNEPGKEDRIKVGYAKDGTAIYARNPVGKIGEEFTGYMTGPLDMMRRKMGTIARPAWQILANDKGFGRHVYDPNAETIPQRLGVIRDIIAHIALSQAPESQIAGAVALVKGEGDAKVNAFEAFGPLAGLTFSKGAPGGPAIGELYHAREMHDYAVAVAMPDIRKQILNGDIGGARQQMTQLGIPKGLQGYYIRTTQNPATRLSKRALDNFYQYATPQQRQRLDNARDQ